MGKQLQKKLFFAFLFVVGLIGNSFSQTNAWINEIHYENAGIDVNETIEIVIENPGTLSDYEVHLYNQAGTNYDNISLDHSDVLPGATPGNFTIYTWELPPNGIQNGPNDGIALIHQGDTIQFLSYEGVVSTSSGLTSVDIGVSESSSTSATASLQLIGSGGQYSDFTWQALTTNTFGAVNVGQTLGGITGNASPVIANIVQNPMANNVAPNDTVTVTADVIDVGGIASVVLHWGTSSGNLPNTIPMNLSAGDTYVTAGSIPAQTAGTTIFYEIVAVDSASETTTSPEQNYTSEVPVYGWQITAANTLFQIDFETTVNNVNNGQFTAAGFRPNPATGQLDTNAWSVLGLSDGDLDFNATATTGDYAHGTSTGGVGTGGVHAFETDTSNVVLGIQPGGSDFTPGKIILKFQNKTGTTITDLKIGYAVFSFNDKNRSSSFNFAHSPDTVNIVPVSSLDFVSEETASDSIWTKNEKEVLLTGLSIAPDEFYYLHWNSDDMGGSGSRDELGLDDIILVANPEATDYVYDNGWNPYSPSGLATIDSVTIVNGTAVLSADTEMDQLVVQTGASLQIEQVLKLNGNLVNDGSLVFVNDSTKLGQLGAMPAGAVISGSGSVTVQRFVPARRAFRFVSPSVTTSSSIHANWQEGASSNSDDPNPGFGTHITGATTDQQNGFDGTLTGNPSLFLFDNVAQSWNSISNTDATTLTAGKAYRLFVRGDRSIDLTNNQAAPVNTVLRTTGNLAIGDQSNSNMSNVAGGFNFIGNPYQSIVDMNDVLTNSTNLNTNHYYVWDPNINTRGGYATVALPGGTNIVGSDANQFLQPEQAAFVATLNNGPASILFEEVDKAPYENPTAVFRGMPNNEGASIVLQLYPAQAFDNGGSVADGLRINFSTSESNTVLPNDAAKIGNIDENLAIRNGTYYLSIEQRALPVDGENISLFNNQYRHNSYTYQAQLEGFSENVKVYLKDDYLQTQTELTNDDYTIVDFTVDENIGASTAVNRFSLLFEVDALSVGTNPDAAFSIFPNPAHHGTFYVGTTEMIGKEMDLSLFDITGQKIFEVRKTANQQVIEIKNLRVNAGIYWVKIACEGTSFTQKIIFQ